MQRTCMSSFEAITFDLFYLMSIKRVFSEKEGSWHEIPEGKLIICFMCSSISNSSVACLQFRGSHIQARFIDIWWNIRRTRNDPEAKCIYIELACVDILVLVIVTVLIISVTFPHLLLRPPYSFQYIMKPYICLECHTS